MYRNGGDDGTDDRFRKKMNARRSKDPVVQDFGSAQDWQASKTGLGRVGDDKAGDDRVSERRGPPAAMVRAPPGAGEMFAGDGGNFWVNPPRSLDRYPVPRRRAGRGRPGGDGRGGRRRRRGAEDEEDEWWATRQRDDDEEGFGGGMEYEDGYGEYGVPPPNRSRSSFRSGAPPPLRPVKEFYDRLFWFGFDPDVTQPTDRTMFGGTRGKFNAMDMLRDRENRQRLRQGGGGGPAPLPPGAAAYDAGPGYRDEYRDEYDAGDELDLGDEFYLGDDDDPGMEVRGGDGGVARQRRRARGAPRRRSGRRPAPARDPRAAQYESLFAGGGGGDFRDVPGDGYPDLPDDDYLPPDAVASPRRQRRGFAYRYDADDLLDLDDGEYIDVEPRYVADPDLAAARGASLAPPSPRDDGADRRGRRRRRRSWEERALEMDRVPPRGAVAWGPGGPLEGENPLDRAAGEALGDIRKAKRALERKEERVEDAKEEVIGLKADASTCEDEQELGYLRRDVDDASRGLRLARAERDAASDRVSELEERHWALLSEFEAARSFAEEVRD